MKNQNWNQKDQRNFVDPNRETVLCLNFAIGNIFTGQNQQDRMWADEPEMRTLVYVKHTSQKFTEEERRKSKKKTF